ncbi:amphi-Trp domain-containing protein [Saccharomonospora sp. NB11]|uniref:amphi-Trp domain-containing protein n=1 Tax=Saccharomonospora sp. NB11 TaxID=1642298 RepID=UPI0018D00E21|nr:amphi-Trp domain-containing protein [Saccharomonospora sp. NB11]
MTAASRDVEAFYSTADVVAKLRRLADALETDKPFRIQIAGERIRVPARARFSIEHERGDGEEEIEFQLKWTIEDADSAAEDSEDDAADAADADKSVV